MSLLVLPLSFLASQGVSSAGSYTGPDDSLSLAYPSCMTSLDFEPSSVREGRNDLTCGVAIGCEDGTFYILRSGPIARGRPEGTQGPTRTTGTSTSLQISGSYRPRSSSPSAGSGFAPFHVTRSRIVSSVSTELAEAPKNYVDFDDEEERLKEMLKGRAMKERSTGGTAEKAAVAEKSPSQVPSSSASSTHTRDNSRAFRSIVVSPASSIRSLSSPPSPTLLPNHEPQDPFDSPVLSLQCHVLPSRFGAGQAITALKSHDDGRFLLCLQRTGDISVYATIDGTCVASACADDVQELVLLGGQNRSLQYATWRWKRLVVAASDEYHILIACASPNIQSGSQTSESENGSPGSQSRLVAFELRIGRTGEDTALRRLGEWFVDASVDAIDLCRETNGSFSLLRMSSSGHFVVRSMNITEASSPPEVELPESGSNIALPLANPFKALKAHSVEHVSDIGKNDTFGRVELGEESEIGEISLQGQFQGMRSYVAKGVVRMIIWSTMELLGFMWHGRTLQKLAAYPVADICDVRWVDQTSFTVLFSDHAEKYSLTEDKINKASEGGSNHVAQPRLIRSIALPHKDCCNITPAGDILSTRVKNRKRRLRLSSFNAFEETVATRTLWKARDSRALADAKPKLTSMLPIELNLIILGFSDGRICRSSLSRLIQARGNDGPLDSSDIPLAGYVVGLSLAENERTKERFIVGGSDDGSVAMWKLDTLKLCARWTIFTTPLIRVIDLHNDKVGRLRGCVLCIAQDGTIAVVAIDGCQFVYLIPASAASLEKVCLGEDNLLLIYADRHARLWDTRTREFWRSMSVDKAHELLKQGGWTEWSVDSGACTSNTVMSNLPSSDGLDYASTLLVDVEAVLHQFHPGPVGFKSSTNLHDDTTDVEPLRALLSALLTFGLSEEIDVICREKLGVCASVVSIGLTSHKSISMFKEQNPWVISPEASATRALALLAILQCLTHCKGLSQDADTVMTFYTVSIGQLIGPEYKPPSLTLIARHWLQSPVAEVRHAARTLFEAGVARLTDQETTDVVESWQNRLPYLRLDIEQDSRRSALALFICGSIAVEKYSLLPTSTLTDIAKSIALYLHDEASPYRSLAIDLCSRGFSIWQQYVDAVEMLRALFMLATTTRKEAISLHNVGLQARSAILQIASSNTPLFMTTVAMDILHPLNVQHRKAVMQLVIFLIRKKPLVLYSNLPRLVEAVVKSLDPNSNATREAVLDSATEILGHIVQTFPNVDFHMATQRLAVGTSEGSVVMYDLKTATRLYVLEGHKKRTTACSFSPDGRRLVTVSLEESVVLVWKVGSSFASFFNPGAPPRQGHSGSEPFKTLSFNVGDAVHMSLACTLEKIHFEWPAERSVKLKIGDAVLTFST